MNWTLAACGAAAVMLIWPGSAGAQTAVDFAGDWKPFKERPMLAELKIVQEGGRWTAHAYGSCTPKPCDWGVVPFTVLQQRPEGRAVGWAIWQIRTSTRYMVMHLGEDVLVVEVYNLFSGARDPGYLVVDELSKSPRSTTSTPSRK